MRKRFLSLAAALALCLSLLPSGLTAAAAPASFSDVKSGDWCYDAVGWAVENGITTGTSSTTFSPGDTCDNAQILTFLWRAAGQPEPNVPNPFDNLSTGDYYYKAALWAYENGLVSGGSFSPSIDCTRAMAVTYIWKAKGMPFSMAPALFDDVALTDFDLSMPVSWAVENGVTTGTSASTFSPGKTCTRAEIVTFLLRAYGGQTSQAVTPQPQAAGAAELLALINSERANAGLNALETSGSLTQAAQLRAEDISKGCMDYRPDGSPWDSVLALTGVSATYVSESMLGGSPAAADTFAMAMGTPSAKSSILNGDLTHVGIGYFHTDNGYGGYSDFWSLLYITDPASSSSTPAPTPTPAPSQPPAPVDFTPVPMAELANLKSLQKKATDDQLAQAYAVALEIVTPLAGLSRAEQLQGIAAALRARFDSGMQYSMSTEHYNDPYGYFILGSASCAGCTRATGLCLNILGIPYEHVNEDGYTHQWCRVEVDGVYWICDAFGLYCGPELAPYTHPYF